MNSRLQCPLGARFAAVAMAMIVLAVVPFDRLSAQDAPPPGDALVGLPGCDGRDYVYFGERLLAIAPATSNVTLSFQTAAGAFSESGNATANIILLSSSGPLGCAVSVTATPWDGTATSADFTPTPVTVTFPAGSPNGTVRTASIPITADTRYEPDEDFTIRLSSPNGARLGASTVFTATILNNDPLPSISIPDIAVDEGSQGTGWTLNATLTLSNESDAPATVLWTTANGTAVAPEDFGNASGTATFNPGTTSTTISISIAGDTYWEGDQSFFINLTSPSGASIADAQAQVTLREDDPPAMYINNLHLLEGTSKGTTLFTFTVSLQGPSHNTIKATFATADCTAVAGSDYVPTSGVIEFPADSTQPQTITVPVYSDGYQEPMEAFKVVLSNLSGAVQGDLYGEGSILNDDGLFAEGAVRRSDFNADGSNDLLFADAATGDLQVWYMNGDTRIAPPVPTNPTKPSSGNWSVVGVNDFNSDGKPDILWRNADSGNLSCWLMDGVNRTTGVLITGQADLTWKVAGTGDFDGDGKADILWRKDDTGDLQIWFMNGTSVLSTAATTPPSPGYPTLWFVQAIGDLNADGKSDLLWRHATAGTAVYWTMNGAVLTSAAAITPSPIDLAWTIVSIFDAGMDAKSDVLIQNAVTGDLVVLHMNGTNEYCGTTLSPQSSGPGLKVVGPR